jgi:hypothetical protein
MLKFLWEFPEVVFPGVNMESPLGEEEICSRQTRTTTKNGFNFLSDRWIAPIFLQEFPKAVFLGVAMESLLGEEEIYSRQTRVTT